MSNRKTKGIICIILSRRYLLFNVIKCHYFSWFDPFLRLGHPEILRKNRLLFGRFETKKNCFWDYLTFKENKFLKIDSFSFSNIVRRPQNLKKITPVLTFTQYRQNKWEIFSNFVAFLENLNIIETLKNIIFNLGKKN